MIQMNNRLFVWYSIAMAVFYCPSNLDNVSDATPKVCTPYLTARAHLTPAIVKYYNEYAAPYAETVKPYVEKAHQNVIKPAGAFADYHYRTHAEHHVKRGVDYSRRTWQGTVDPKLRDLKKTAQGKYDTHVAPHARRVCEVTAPHHKTMREIYEFSCYHFNFIRSFYVDRYNRYVHPTVVNAYEVSYDVTTTRVLPYISRTLTAFFEFMNGTVRGHVTGLYSQNVEPQLVKISQKLASYREAQENKAKPTTHEATSRSLGNGKGSGSERLTSSGALSSKRASQSSATSASATSDNHITRREINQDLSDFEARLTASAKKGSANLYERVSDIVEKKTQGEPAGRLEVLVADLEMVAKQELGALRNKTQDVPVELGFTEGQQSLDHFTEAVKAAGLTIKTTAQGIRAFVSDFGTELVDEVSSSINTTVEVLASVRDLSLQQVSAKWAYVDGVVYEDWEKYHALKTRLSQWQSDLENVGFMHKGLVDLRDQVNSLLARALAVAEDAAVELKQIKDDGVAKIQGRIHTEDEAQLGRSDELVGDSAPADKVDVGEQLVLRAADDSKIVGHDAASHSEQLEQSELPPSDVTSTSSGIDIDSALETEKSRDVEDFKKTHHQHESDLPSPSPSPSPPSTSSSSSALVDSAAASASSASSRLSEELLHATQALQTSLQHASATLAAEKSDAVVLDAKRRYYEAIGLAHDQFSAVFHASLPSTSTSTPAAPAPASSTPAAAPNSLITPSKTSAPNAHPLDVTDSPIPQYPEQRSQKVAYANEEYSSISSFLSNSLDAVIYSINSVNVNEKSTANVLSDASERHSQALSAAQASRSSVEREAEMTSEDSREQHDEMPSPAPTSSEGMYSILPVSEGESKSSETVPTEGLEAAPEDFVDSKTDGDSSVKDEL